MKQKFVRDLVANETITETFLVREKDVRAKRTGEPYLSMVLADKTGELDAKMWDNVAEYESLFERDDFVRVKGLVQVYRNKPQLTVHKVQKCGDADVDLADYFPTTEKDVEAMYAELLAIVEQFQNPHLKALLLAILRDDPDVNERLRRAPAAKSMHHAYLGGLLEHILSLCKLCQLVAQNYEGIDRDLLLTGAILHDIGKLWELDYERGVRYTNEGQLLGHMIIELELVNKKIVSLPDFPDHLKMMISHLIISHHGEYQFGSPKLPMTVEALLLHMLDNLDSKVQAMQWAARHDPNLEGEWTSYLPIFQRPIYRGARNGNPGPSAARGTARGDQPQASKSSADPPTSPEEKAK